MVEFMPRIIQRAIPDSRDGRTARQSKPNGTEPSTRGVEPAPRDGRNAAGLQRQRTADPNETRDAVRGKTSRDGTSKTGDAALCEELCTVGII